MRRAVSVASSWTLLVLLWIAFVGTTDTTEVLVGLLAAAIATFALEVVRAQRLLGFRFERATFIRALGSIAHIPYDFGIVTWELVRALARRRRVAGAYVELPFSAGETGRAQHAWRRAVTTVAGSVAPNTIVVHIDPEQNSALVHTLRADLRAGSSLP